MAALVNVPDSFNGPLIAAFIAASSTYGKVLVDVSPGSGTAGAAGFRSGGTAVMDLLAWSSDSVANNVIVWEGLQTTLYANMGVAATTATTNATVTRTTGSFVTDGYTVGDNVMLFGSAGAANNGVVLTVTAVATLTLTFNGVPASFSANTEAAGFRIVRVHKRSTVPVAAGAATTTGANVQLFASTYDKTLYTLGTELGPLGMLIVSPAAAVSALPAQLSVEAKVGYR